jgi:transposase
LLKQRDPDTVYGWVYAFDAVGIKSLSHAPRKRKASLTQAEREQLRETITEKSPQDFSLSGSRWTLKTLRKALPFLKRVYRSLSGVWYLFRRLRIHYKRSLDFVPCPDPKKKEKIRRIRALLGYARKHLSKVVLLFLDEFSFYRQPLRGSAWWPVGRRQQPKAKRSRNADTRGREVAALNAVSGKLIYHVASKINVPCFCDFLRHLREVYPDAKIYVVLDNWLVARNEAITNITSRLKHSLKWVSFLFGCRLTLHKATRLNFYGNNSTMKSCVSTGIVMIGQRSSNVFVVGLRL